MNDKEFQDALARKKTCPQFKKEIDEKEFFERQQALDTFPVTAAKAKHMKDQLYFQGIPGITCSPNGRIFAACYAGGVEEGPSNFVKVFISDDRGKSWSDAVSVVDPTAEKISAFDPCLWTTPEGKVLLFYAQGYSSHDCSRYDGRGGVWFTELTNPDADPSTFAWTTPIRITDGIMLNKPAVLRDGTWAMPVTTWAHLAGYYPIETDDHGTKLVVSKDNGKTFTQRSKFIVPKQWGSFDEHSFIELPDGSIKVYARAIGGYVENISPDNGKTWGEVTFSDIPGPDSRMYVTRLASGNIIRIGHDMDDPKSAVRSKMTVWLSKDDGKTWSGKLCIDNRTEVSYPDCCQTADGTIFVIHDFNRYAGGFIVISKITEEDILAGKLVNQDSEIGIIAASSNPCPPKQPGV